MKTPNHVSPYLLLTLANLFWAGNWIISRAFRGELPPVALSFWRWVVALLCLLTISLPHVRRDWPQLRAAWPWLLFFGALGTGGYNVLVYGGLQYTTAINGTLLNSFIPIMIVLISWLLLGKRLHRREAAGILISFLGVLAIVARGELQHLRELRLNVGDLWILASVLAWSAYTLLLSRRPQVHPLAFLTAISVTGLIFLVPFYLWELAQGRHVIPTPGAIAGIVYTGVFPAFLGYILWNRGVAEVGPARAGLFMHLVPAFGILLSMIFLDEKPASYHAVGIALIFTGIWLNTRRIR
ncbi:MAG: DMT family transporter [Sulfuritalea sp.]|nr:DMT family transporter [Sulfuritalea sp.]MDP1983313.1 DMT family transporter [Sulfuritalea sp.]